MGSIMFNIACPQCGRVAVEDFYYKSEQRYVFCECCGYNFSQEEKYNKTDNKYYLEVKEHKGYGIFVLAKKKGRGKMMFLNSPVNDDDIEKYRNQFEGKNIDREKSCLVVYKDGEFTILFGQVPKNFHLSFEEYKKKYDYDPFRENQFDEEILN